MIMIMKETTRLLACLLPLLLCANGEMVQIISRNSTVPVISTRSIPPMKFGGCTYDTVKINPNGYFTLGQELRMHYTIPYLSDFPMPIIAPRGAADKLRLFYIPTKEQVFFNIMTLNTSLLANSTSNHNFPPPCVDVAALPLTGNVTIWLVSYQTFTDVKNSNWESDSRAYLIYDSNTTFLLFYHVAHSEEAEIYKRSFVYGFSYGYRDSALPPTFLALNNSTDESELTATYEKVAHGTNIIDANSAPGCYLYQIVTAATCKPSRSVQFSRHQMSVVRARVVNYNRQLLSPAMTPFTQCRNDTSGRRTVCSCRKGYVGNGQTCKRNDLWIPVNETAVSLQLPMSCLDFGSEYSQTISLGKRIPFGDEKYDSFTYFEDGFLTFGELGPINGGIHGDEFDDVSQPTIDLYESDINATNAQICHLVAPGPLSGTAAWSQIEAVISSMRRDQPRFVANLSLLVSYENIAPDKLGPDDFQVYRNPYRSGFESTSAQVLLVSDQVDTYLFFIYRFNDYSYALPWNESNYYKLHVGFSAYQGDRLVPFHIVSLPEQNVSTIKQNQSSVINAYALDQYVGNLQIDPTLSGWAYKVSGTVGEPPENIQTMCTSNFTFHGRMVVAKLQNNSVFDCVSSNIYALCKSVQVFDVYMDCSELKLISTGEVSSSGENSYLPMHDHGNGNKTALARISFRLDLQLTMPCSSPSRAYMENTGHVSVLARRAINSALLSCGSIAEQRSTQLDLCFAPIKRKFEVKGPPNLSLPVALNKTYVADVLERIRAAYNEKYQSYNILVNSPVVVEGQGDRYNMTVLIQGHTCEEETADLIVSRVALPELQPAIIEVSTTTSTTTTTSIGASNVTEISTTQQAVMVQQGGSRKVRALLTALCVVFALLACILTFFVVKFYRQIKASTRRKSQYDRVEFCKSTTSIVRAVDDDENNIIDRPAGVRDDVAIFRIDS